MLIFGNMIKRFCHQHSRHILPIVKKGNPLVECEKKCMKSSINNNQNTVYVNNKLVTIENNKTNISICYVDKENKFCKIDINIYV
jgi:hypothetical protein